VEELGFSFVPCVELKITRGLTPVQLIKTGTCGKGLLAGMIFLVCHFCPKAQTHIPGQFYASSPIVWSPLPSFNQTPDGRLSNKPWFFSKSISLSAGTSFTSSGYGTFLSVPIGLQINRQLNNNLYAFMGVYAAPTVAGYNHSYVNPPFNKGYSPYTTPGTYGFGINPGIQMGLMHVNDAGTFSISGSISVERSNYPYYPPASNYSKKH
jgi:hypothetical protein